MWDIIYQVMVFVLSKEMEEDFAWVLREHTESNLSSLSLFLGSVRLVLGMSYLKFTRTIV